MERIPASHSSSWLTFPAPALPVPVWKFVPRLWVDPNGRRGSITVKNTWKWVFWYSFLQAAAGLLFNHLPVLQAQGLLCGFSLSKMCIKHWHFWCHSYLYSVMTQALEKSCWNYMFHSFNFLLLTREWFALSCLSSSLPLPGSIAQRFPCWVSQAKLVF